MFVLANFVQEVDFKQSKLPKVNVVLPEFNLFVFPSFWVIEKSCFKAQERFCWTCLKCLFSLTLYKKLILNVHRYRS